MGGKRLPPLLARYRVVGDCWEWTGEIDKDGYGRGWVPELGRIRLAHRLLYEAHRGPIPAGLQLDHVCRNRRCVNPDHLEPVTQQENIRRSDGVQAINARKTACHNGHPFDEANTYVCPRGRRECRICRTAASRAYYERKKVA